MTSNPEEPLSFHVVHTTGEDSFGLKNKRAIESIFFHHPRAQVVVHARTMSETPLRYLKEAGFNIKIRHYDPRDEVKRLIDQTDLDQRELDDFVKRIEAFEVDQKGFWYSNESNLMRLILMFLEGGVYLDADIIVTRSFYDLPINTLGRQDDKTVNGAVLYFERGHEYIKACLEEFFRHFNNKAWGNNGPGLMTRVLSDFHTGNTSLNVENPATFYFFHYKYIKKDCFEDNRQEKVMKRLARIRRSAFAVHLNNHLNATIGQGTACSCLVNAFCVGSHCQREPQCSTLTEKVETLMLEGGEFGHGNRASFSPRRNFSTSDTGMFHLIHTTDDQTFGSVQKRSLESIFYHHKKAKVVLHVKNMTQRPVQYLIDAGFDLQVRAYDSKQELLSLKDQNIVSSNLIDRFVDKMDGYADDTEGNWYSNESNLLRMIFLLREGGVYMDTDAIVIRPLVSLPDNTLGYQDVEQTRLNGAVMKFKPGHPYIKACLVEFLQKFKNRRWGANGPRLLTRVFEKQEWDQVVALPSSYFQFFDWRYIAQDCYEDTRGHKVQKRLRAIREKSYVMHLNNHLDATLQVGSVCHCLLTSYCLSEPCTKLDVCDTLRHNEVF